MITIKKTENIFDVISKIKEYKTEKKSIVINFPFGHNVLYNKVNLKCIKESTKKKIIIKTNDVLSKKIWKELWIKYSIINKNNKFSKNKNLLKYNYNFYEYLIYEIKIILNKISSKVFRNKKNIDPRKKFLKYYKQKSYITWFIIILILSILIFSYIFIFALNKTYVFITPNIQVKTKAQNFIFDTNIKKEESSINLKTFEEQVSLKKKISSSWIIQNDRHKARWTVEFYNKLEEEIKLLANTRIESEIWIIYEIKEPITIPAAQINSNWKVVEWTKKAEIRAKTKDKYWKRVWERWNIKKLNVILTIPWLEDENKTNIFARTHTEIKNWKNIFEKVISESDLENWKKFFIENLKKEAIKKIINKINKSNNETNTKLEILPIDDIYKYSDIIVDIPEIKPLEKIDEFEISWSIKIKTYTFNIDSVTSKLKKSIEDNILEEKEKLLFINDKSIDIFPQKWVLYRIEEPFKVKATLEIEYNIEYNFKKENDNYLRRLKQMISWIDKEKAENILINENLISDANIKIRPFFVKNVSKYLNNIEFEIKK